jgi:hypothetical protein
VSLDQPNLSRGAGSGHRRSFERIGVNMSNLQPSTPVGDVTLFTAVDRTKDPGFFTPLP